MDPKTRNRIPDFMVIGAPKSGTSALYYCLFQHPEIFMSPVKEPHFFTFEGKAPVFSGPKGDHFHHVAVCKPLDYLFLFAGATTQLAVGEASTTYLNSPVAAQRIKKFAPAAKIIALLRQPADRAYSHYQYLRSQGVEPVSSFAKVLAMESSRKKDGWFPGHLYKEGGYYFSQLSTYFNLFPREQIKIYLYDDWNQSPRAVLQDLFRFLAVDESFTPEIRRSNVTLLPRSNYLNSLLKNRERQESGLLSQLPAELRQGFFSGMQILNNRFNLYRPPSIGQGIRRQLIEEYREDICNLQCLIGRDLSHWLL